MVTLIKGNLKHLLLVDKVDFRAKNIARSKACKSSDRFSFMGAPKSLQMVTAAMKFQHAPPWKKSYDKSRQHIKK